MLSWVVKILSFTLGFSLLFSKRHSKLGFTQLYLFASSTISIVYKLIFPNGNWTYFLYFNAIGGAILFALAYWEIARKQEGKSYHLLIVAAVVIYFVPMFPIPNIAKPVTPFFIVDTIIACTLPFALRRRNPFLIILSTAASLGIALDILQYTVPTIYESLLLGAISVANPVLAYAGMLGVLAWDPAKAWVSKMLRETQASGTPDLSLVHENAGEGNSPNAHKLTLVEFSPTSDDPTVNIEVDPEESFILDPMLESAAKMLTISKKPYLTPDEAMFYLGMNDIAELEEFIERFNIQTLRLSSKQSTWVVRREALENID